jgi:hypothetical protein
MQKAAGGNQRPGEADNNFTIVHETEVVKTKTTITGWADPWLDDNEPSERSHHPYDPDHLPEGYTELTDEERQRRLDMLRTIFPKQD